MTDRQLVIVGHPNCGCKYLHNLLQKMNIQVGYEEWEEDGIVSWYFSVDSKTLTSLRASYALRGTTRDPKLFPSHLVHYTRDPLDAIPDIMESVACNSDEYFYQRRIIQHVYNIDLDSYKPLDRAVASFLFWNKMIEQQDPEFVVRVEDAYKPLRDYISTTLHKSIPNKINVEKLPHGTACNWTPLQNDLLQLLDKWCYEYGYPNVSTRLCKKQQLSQPDKPRQLLSDRPIISHQPNKPKLQPLDSDPIMLRQPQAVKTFPQQSLPQIDRPIVLQPPQQLPQPPAPKAFPPPIVLGPRSKKPPPVKRHLIPVLHKDHSVLLNRKTAGSIKMRKSKR